MEKVVLLDESGRAIGTIDKATVHHENTPLHLAFSCYVFNSRQELLITKRALAKKTWPGVWTNSCCGHPGPDEALPDAISRRLSDELGITSRRIDLVLPRFQYRAIMDNGMVENEKCPVYRAFVDAQPTPDPAEVADTRWISWQTFAGEVNGGEFAVSPWCEQQVAELIALGANPDQWPVAAQEALPPAARV